MNDFIKTIFLIVVWCYCQVGLANNELPLPIKTDYFIGNGSFEFKVVNDLYRGYFLDAYFEDDNSSLNLETRYTVTFLEILNEEEKLEYKIPVYTNDINLNLENFEIGKYLLLLYIKGEPFPVATVFIKK